MYEIWNQFNQIWLYLSLIQDLLCVCLRRYFLYVIRTCSNDWSLFFLLQIKSSFHKLGAQYVYSFVQGEGKNRDLWHQCGFSWRQRTCRHPLHLFIHPNVQPASVVQGPQFDPPLLSETKDMHLFLVLHCLTQSPSLNHNAMQSSDQVIKMDAFIIISDFSLG